jgi:glyoxylase-like metal-dependent hydrolase (beta-lactamase superfamily II)
MRLANSFLFENVLVDAGVVPGKIERFHGAVEVIVLTHCHFDHTARVREVARICNAKIAIHELDADGLRDDEKSLAFNFGAHSPGIAPDIILSEGDRVGSLKVLHTPGHTPGGICLYHEDSHALISGDTVFADGGFGRYDFPGGSRVQLEDSLARLADLPVEELCPGHGEPVRQGGSRHIVAALGLLRSGYG